MLTDIIFQVLYTSLARTLFSCLTLQVLGWRTCWSHTHERAVPATRVPIGHNEFGVNSIYNKPDMRNDLSNNFQSTMAAIGTTPCGNNAHDSRQVKIVLDTSMSSEATKR